MPLSVKYAFTLTLQPKLYKYKPEEQYDLTYMHVTTLLKALISTVDVIAELTVNCNLHYHGVIQFKSFKKSQNLELLFRNTFRADKYIGFVNIRQLTDEEGWLEYITKDISHTRNSINRPPVLLNEFEDIRAPEPLEFMYCHETECD